jgi:hypothetical protein
MAIAFSPKSHPTFLYMASNMVLPYLDATVTAGFVFPYTPVNHNITFDLSA